jgi:hypothetical protein
MSDGVKSLPELAQQTADFDPMKKMSRAELVKGVK